MNTRPNIAQKRETAALLMLVVVIISMFRPVSPFIADALAHTFWSEQHHMALHQTGADHIDAQIEKINETSGEEQGSAAPSTINLETSFVYFNDLTELKYNSSLILIIYPEYCLQLFQHSIAPGFEPPDNSGYALPLFA